MCGRKTLRIVSYRMEVQDVTGSLLAADDELRRIVAVSRLTVHEARLLGVDGLKAKQKLLYNPSPRSDDKKLCDGLASNTLVLSISDALGYLEED
jgi:hypothetical protein